MCGSGINQVENEKKKKTLVVKLDTCVAGVVQKEYCVK